MATQLTMLGTGGAMSTHCYNTCFTLCTDNEYMLVDAGGGNGILVQVEKAGISWLKIRTLFITHGHTDHVLGAIWVIRTVAMLMGREQYTGNFTIYSHNEVIDILHTLCNMMLPPKFMKYLDKRILLTEVADGTQVDVLDMKLRFFDIGSTKKKQYGFQALLPGEIKLACLGDEPFHERTRTYVEGADWLLCDAFCLDRDKERFHPHEKHHSTVLEAAATAQKLNIKNLVLYHTEDLSLDTRKNTYTAEAQQAFSGKIFVPDDLETITILSTEEIIS